MTPRKSRPGGGPRSAAAYAARPIRTFALPVAIDLKIDALARRLDTSRAQVVSVAIVRMHSAIVDGRVALMCSGCGEMGGLKAVDGEMVCEGCGKGDRP